MYKFFLSENVFSSGDSMITCNSDDRLTQKEEIRRIKTQNVINKLNITDDNITKKSNYVPEKRKKIIDNILKSCDEESDISSLKKRALFHKKPRKLYKPASSVDKCSVEVNVPSSKLKCIKNPHQCSKTSMNSFKYLLPPKDFKQENVDILCTDLSNKNLIQHILDTAKTLQAYEYQVTIVTAKMGPGLKNTKNIRIIEVGNFIPENFLGIYQSFFYVLRSIYLALWYCMGIKYWNYIEEPTIMFCESSTLVLPILYYSGIKTAHFQYKYDLLKKNNQLSTARIESNILTKFCLSYADAVLLPNKTLRHIYYNYFKSTKLNLHVLYPFLRSKKNNKEVFSLKALPKSCYNPESIIYLTLGEFNERSNFELAIESFDFLLTIVDESMIKKIFLVLSGHYCKYNIKQVQYYEKIHNMVKNSSYPSQIILLKHLSPNEKKQMIKMCTVFVHTTVDEIFNSRVLEAMSLAKPVIASDTGFMREAIIDGTTGFLIEPYYTNFALAMNKYIITEKAASIMGNLAQVDFVRKYTLLAFGERLRKFIKKLTKENEKKKLKNNFFKSYPIFNTD